MLIIMGVDLLGVGGVDLLGGGGGGWVYWGERGGLTPLESLENPSHKVLNPTKISLHPSYYV
jgi:hypothetical protein